MNYKGHDKNVAWTRGGPILVQTKQRKASACMIHQCSLILGCIERRRCYTIRKCFLHFLSCFDFSFVRFFLTVNQGFFWVRDDTALSYTLNSFSGHGLMMNSVFGLHFSPKMSIALGYFKSITRIIMRGLFRNLARGNLNDKDERAKKREKCHKSTT